MVALLVLALALSVAGMCPVMECVDLQPGVCARQSAQFTVQLSKTPCPQGNVCSAVGLLDWYNSLSTPVGEILPCQAASSLSSLNEQQLYPAYFCGDRIANKTYPLGTLRLQCDSDANCQMLDGTYGKCMCGLRGDTSKGYCQPDISDKIFDHFWNACQNGFIQDYQVAVYFTEMWRLFPYLQERVTCADKLFFELGLYATKQRYYEQNASAEAALVGAALVLAFS